MGSSSSSAAAGGVVSPDEDSSLTCNESSSSSTEDDEIEEPYVQSLRTHPVRPNLFAVLLAGHPPRADSYVALCERPMTNGV